MFIKTLVLSNFKSHTYSSYQFGKTNHFFGDNFTGKSSIGDAIVFGLFGVSRHGYKMYIKDYLQEGATTMYVEMIIQIHNQDYTIKRTMTAQKGTTSVFLNNKPVKEKEIERLVGDYKAFVYCFFPDFFPDEDKSSSRAFLIDHMFSERNDYDELEKEKARIIREQKQIHSNITFYEGQKVVLKKQAIAMVNNPDPILPIEHVNAEIKTIQTELEKITNETQEQIENGIELKSQLKSFIEQMAELESDVRLSGERCPTCFQPISSEQFETITNLKKTRYYDLKKEIDKVETGIGNAQENYANLLKRKAQKEQRLQTLQMMISYQQNINQVSQHSTELINVENKLHDLTIKKKALSDELKRMKHRQGVAANDYQNQINQHLTHTSIELFKVLKNGELRPDFQICYKNRTYRVLSNSEKIRCVLEIVSLINTFTSYKYPLFLDNMEGVTHLEPPEDIQIITATVKKGVPLTLKVKD
ncbi:AAA family ATPase [Bacillus marasmi]|uniref:AAA family ATPase n=1 Tax=Bacillus marasmi TaxID=1926279 RepID=UPI0011CCABEF|nr:AAA family ATPase [Bacillus marasmi]